MPPERMISRIDIKNFKSIKEAQLDLRPLTVLVGENSAGKSSVLQSLLLLAQITRGHTRPDIVALNGSDLKLGNFSDVIHEASAEEPLELALTVPVRGPVLARAYSARWVTRQVRKKAGGDASGEGATWLLGLSESPNELGVARVQRIEIYDSLDGVKLDVWPNDAREEVARLYERSRSLGILRPSPRARGRFLAEAASVATFQGSIDVDEESREAEEPERLPAVAVENGFPIDLYAVENESLALAKQWLMYALRESGVAPIRLRASVREGLKSSEDSTSDDDPADAAELAGEFFPDFRRWVDALDRQAQPEAPNWEEATALRAFLLGDAVPSVLAGLLEEVREERGAIVPRPSAALSVAGSLSSLLYGIHALPRTTPRGSESHISPRAGRRGRDPGHER